MGRLIEDKYKEWEKECDERFNQLKANEEELNRIFIEIYGLQEELTPEVEDKDVTVRKSHDFGNLFIRIFRKRLVAGKINTGFRILVKAQSRHMVQKRTLCLFLKIQLFCQFIHHFKFADFFLFQGTDKHHIRYDADQ